MSIFSGLILKNTFWQILGKSLTLIISLFFVTPLLTAYLGESGYGAYTFITAFVLFFGNIADWGTSLIGVREVSSRGHNYRIQAFSSILVSRLILSIFAITILNFIIRINPNWRLLVSPVSIASLAIFFLSLKTSFAIIFQSLLRFEFSALVEIVSASFLAAGVVFVRIVNGDLTLLMLVWTLSVTVAAIVAIFFGLYLSPLTTLVSPQLAKRVFLEALPTGALLVVFTIYNRVDIVILEHFRPESDVGIYGLSYKIYDNIVMMAAFIMNSLFPIISRGFKKFNMSFLKGVYQGGLSLLVFLGVVVGSLTFIFATPFIHFLGQGQFDGSVQVLQILSIAIIFAYVNHLTGYSLIALGKQRISLLIAVIALSFNVMLNILLIPIYSYIAAAYITILTEGIVFLLSAFAIWKIFGFLPSISIKDMLKVIKS